MSAATRLRNLRTAIYAFADRDDDDLVDAWHRIFHLTGEPAVDVFAGLPCEEKPPTVYQLATRVTDRGRFEELWWAYDPEAAPAIWPVVELGPDGEIEVVAANLDDWIDTLLFTGGVLAGGSEDELEAAAEDASHDGRALAADLLDEFDRDPRSASELGDRWEAAVDQFFDPWSDAIDGLDEA